MTYTPIRTALLAVTLGLLPGGVDLPSGTAAEAGSPTWAPPEPEQDPTAGKTITELDPAPLPSRVVLPMPPRHDLAADADELAIDAEAYARARAAIDRGIDGLLALQGADGLWMPSAEATPSDQPDMPAPVSIAVSAMAVKAIVQARPEAVDTAPVRRALDAIQRARRADGAYEGGALTNYVTATVVSMLVVVDHAEGVAPDLRADLDAAVDALQSGQWDEAEGIGARKDWYGGAGYGKHGRPDLSNTQLMLEALYDAGMSPDEPAFQRSLQFLSRAQNLRAVNPADWTGDDGGFVYTPAGGGESMASEAAGEGRRGELLPSGTARALRSYGSMTYAGFKSLLYAGLSQDDVRVRAAYDWIRRHWTFDENPGMGAQGHYYYLHAMARALRVGQQPVVTDAEGTAHEWRSELIEALASRQRPDGTWVNESDRWLEAEPALATCYALLALEETIK